MQRGPDHHTARALASHAYPCTNTLTSKGANQLPVNPTPALNRRTKGTTIFGAAV